MPSTDHNQPDLSDVFSDAAEIGDPAAREAYLDRACGGDETLRRRVEALLAAEQSHGPPLDGAPPELRIGDGLGRYKLLERIGEGGCGVVYVAEQEVPVHRRVALKVIKAGMDTREVLKRFEAERQALALMEHPGIARVLDAGASDSGRPYFVMELVRGVAVTDYCDGERLPTEARLRLFIEVCHAVQHAHQKGIIHRDLKPSNVLVTEVDGKPQPKVIDFGVAKAIEGRLTDLTLYTSMAQLVGTPSYMSPEQASLAAAGIDTRSDVYSLGVLLYELLTGEVPFDTESLLSSGLDEMRRTIRERTPPRPSERIGRLGAEERSRVAQRQGSDSPRLIGKLRGDLDWIVMKCLEKECGRRYQTANGLAMDIRRHLNAEPVLARPPSRLYLLSTAVRRHKAGFAATAAVVLSFAGGLAGVVWQWNRALANEQLALRNADRAAASERRALQNAYAADIRDAQRSLEGGDLGSARSLLERYAPGRDASMSPTALAEDLRGWEWRYLWARCQGDEHTLLHRYPSWVGGVSISPDGALLAVQTSDAVAVWDLKAREQVGRLPAVGLHGAMAFSPVDNRIAVANADPKGDPEVVLWDPRDPSATVRLPHVAAVLSLAFTTNGEYLATKDSLESLRVWEVESRSVRARFDASQPASFQSMPSGGVLRFSPDGTRLAFQSRISGVSEINWRDQGAPRVVEPPSIAATRDTKLARVTAITYSPDGRWLAWGLGDGTIRLWNTIEQGSVGELMNHHDAVHALAFAPGSSRLASAGGDQTIRIWDLEERREERTLRGHEDEVWSLDFIDGETLASGGRDGTVRLWDLTMPPALPVDRSLPIVNMSFTRDGRQFLAVESGPSTVGLWDSRSLDRVESLPELGASIGQVALSADDRWLALFRKGESRVDLWDWSARSKEKALTVPGDAQGLGFFPDGRTLWVRYRTPEAAVRYGGHAVAWKLWKTGTWEEIPTGALDPYPSSARVAPDSRSVALGYESGELELRSFPEHGFLARFEGYASKTSHLRFSPDGMLLAAASSDGAVLKLWSVGTGAKTLELRDRFRPNSVAFSRDSRRLAVGRIGDANEGPQVTLWDLATRRKLLALHGASRGVGFSPDCRTVFAGEPSSPHYRMRFWQAPSWEEIQAAAQDSASHPASIPGD